MLPELFYHSGTRFSLPFDKLRMYGSMVLYLFCWLFFRPAGAKKQPTKDENPRYA